MQKHPKFTHLTTPWLALLLPLFAIGTSIYVGCNSPSEDVDDDAYSQEQNVYGRYGRARGYGYGRARGGYGGYGGRGGGYGGYGR